MPVDELMTWDSSKNRWKRKHNGIMYRVSCSQLKMPNTKFGSLTAANQWWRNKQAELEGSEPQPEPNPIAERLERLIPVASPEEAIEIRSRMDKAKKSKEPDWNLLEPEQPERIRILQEALQSRMVDGRIVIDPSDLLIRKLLNPEIDILKDRVRRTDKQKPPTEKTLTACIERYVAINRVREISEGRIRTLRKSLQHLKDCLGRDFDCSTVSPLTVEAFNLYLRKNETFAPSTRRMYWQVVNDFFKWLWKNDILDSLPKNLGDRIFAFKQSAPEKNIFTVADLRTILSSFEGRYEAAQMKACILLALNCGFYQVDIGSLKPSQLDNGYLTHKRIKTKGSESVPTVRYKLWERTAKAIEETGATSGQLLFTTNRGTPLHCGKQDRIGQKFERKLKALGIKGSFGDIRNTVATILETHENYGRYGFHFLGHAPENIKDRHYAHKAQGILDNAIEWLEGQIFELKVS